MIFSHKNSLARVTDDTSLTRWSATRTAGPTSSTGVLGKLSHACEGARSRAPRRRRAASAGAERDHRIRGRARQMAHRTRTRQREIRFIGGDAVYGVDEGVALERARADEEEHEKTCETTKPVASAEYERGLRGRLRFLIPRRGRQEPGVLIVGSAAERSRP